MAFPALLPRLSPALVLLLAPLPATAAECVAVDGDRLTAAALAAALPGLDPALDLGPAPYPGLRRILTGPQLARWRPAAGPESARWPASLCVIRAAAPLDPGRLTEALTAAAAELLPGEVPRLELLDYPHQPFPAGRLHFGRAGIAGAPPGVPDAPVLWRGTLELPEHRTLAIWARVRLLVDRSCARAAEPLAAGAPLAPGAFTVETRAVNPFHPAACAAPPPEGGAGLVLRRAVAAGEPLLAANLRHAPAVRRGDTVKLEWREGNAALTLPAVAEADGEPGRLVPLRLAGSGRRLRGRVLSAGRVTVEPGENR